MTNPLPDDPWPNDPEAPRGKDFKIWEAARAAMSLRSDFQWLLSSGYQAEALEFLSWAQDRWADAIWSGKR